MIVHEPAPVRCTLAALTVQLPLAEKETGRAEEAEAETAKSGAPNVVFAEDGVNIPKELPEIALDNVLTKNHRQRKNNERMVGIRTWAHRHLPVD